jgi:hypothetical protein
MGFFIIFNSNSGKDEPQTLHYAITQNRSMGADVRQLVVFHTFSERGNGRGNFTEAQMQKAPR